MKNKIGGLIAVKKGVRYPDRDRVRERVRDRVR
jgi:hypothetical protein